MGPKFGENAEAVIKKMRGGDKITVEYDPVSALVPLNDF